MTTIIKHKNFASETVLIYFSKKLNISCELILLNKYLLFLESLTCALRTQVNKTLFEYLSY